MNRFRINPKQPAAAEKRNALLPSPESPWDSNEGWQVNPHDPGTTQILKDLERRIKTDEWKESAMRNNAFDGDAVRRLYCGNNKSAPPAEVPKQSSSPPTAKLGKMGLSSAKRLRLT